MYIYTYLYISIYILIYIHMYIQKNSHKNYLGLYARVATHLRMACSKGTEKEAEDNQPNARMRTHGDNPRYTCQELTSLFV